MSAFTPGRWGFRVLADGISVELYAADGDVDPVIAYIDRDMCETDEQAHADARLMAAAPDLLEALKAILPWQDSHPAKATDSPLINQCRAAIAKAEGTSA